MQPRPREAALIESAFSAAPYPDDLVLDPSPYHLESKEIQAAFAGKRWQDLPLPVLRHHHQSLAFLTPQGFRYFLPAYLLACIDDYEGAGDIPSSVLYHLTPPEDDDPRACAFFRARVDTLSVAEKKAIRAFFEAMRDEHGEDDDWELSLRRFWAAAPGPDG
jgi:hypothetical protein